MVNSGDENQAANRAALRMAAAALRFAVNFRRKIRRMRAVGIAMITLGTAVRVERDVHAALGFELGEHLFLQLGDDRLVLGTVDEVLQLMGILLQIVELVAVPDAVVVDVLVATGADGLNGGRLREVALPIVGVEQIFSPGDLFAFEQRQEALAGQGGGRRDSGGLHERGHEVDVGELFADDGAFRDRLGTACQEGNADGLFVGLALVDEPVLAEAEAVVAGEEDVGGVEFAALLEEVEYSAEGLVDGEKRLGIAFVVVGDGEGGVVIGEFDAVPAVSLILDPHGTGRAGIGGGFFAFGRNEVGVGVAAFVALGGYEVGVDSFVGQIDEIGLFLGLLGDPVEGIVSEFVGNVAFLRDVLAIDVQAVLVGQVTSLPSEADPFIEAGLRFVAAVSHVPLADESRFITGLLQIVRKERGAGRDGGVVIDDFMLESVLAGEHGGAAGRAERSGDEGVFAMGSFAGQPIHVGSLEERLGFHEA